MTINHNMTPTQTYILKAIMQIKSILTTMKHKNVTTTVKADYHNNTSIKPFRPSDKTETGDSKQILSPVKDPNFTH